MIVWILSRFVHGPVGSRVPGQDALDFEAEMSASGASCSHVDPLDAWFVAGAAPGFRLETPSLPEPESAVFLVDPLRQDADPRFARCLEAAGVRCFNRADALDAFSDPMSPLDALAAAGVAVEKTAKVRRPHPVDAVVSEFGLPLEIVVPLAERSSGTVTIADRGSLRGTLDHLWRGDFAAFVRRGRVQGEAEDSVVVAGGREFGNGGGLALRAAAALSLDFGSFVVRGSGSAARVCSAAPFPAAPGSAPAREALEAIAGSVASWLP